MEQVKNNYFLFALILSHVTSNYGCQLQRKLWRIVIQNKWSIKGRGHLEKIVCEISYFLHLLHDAIFFLGGGRGSSKCVNYHTFFFLNDPFLKQDQIPDINIIDIVYG